MAQSKTWLVDRSFWQSWEHNNKPLPVPWDSKEWVCIDQEPVWGTAITHKGMSKILNLCFSKVENNITPSGSKRNLRESFQRNVSVHHSWNRGVAIHGINYLRLENNFAYQVMGYTFFIEVAVCYFYKLSLHV